MELEAAAGLFVEWLERRVVTDARGDALAELTVKPSGRFWLGRLSPEAAVRALGLGDRGERLDPCATGIRLRPALAGPWALAVTVSARAWLQQDDDSWKKTETIATRVSVTVPPEVGEHTFGTEVIATELEGVSGHPGLSAQVRVEVSQDPEMNPELTVLLVNTSPDEHDHFKDTNLYQCVLEVGAIETRAFTLEALPDSFRYNRDVLAYGVNCSVKKTSQGTLRTADTVDAEKRRPVYWGVTDPEPDLSGSSHECMQGE